jgi:uncharacterized membrane protein
MGLDSNKDNIRDNRTGYIILGLLLLASFILRIYNLTSASLTQDEAWEYFIAKMPLMDILGELHLDVHPAFRVIYHFWLLLGDSEFHLRMFSVLCGVATVLFAFLAGLELRGLAFGTIAGLVFAFSPVNVLFSQNARSYQMLVMLNVASIYAFIRMTGRSSVPVIILYVGASALAVLTHPFSLYIILAENIAFFAGKYADREFSYTVRKWIGVQCVVAAIILPYLVLFVQALNQGFGSYIYVSAIAQATPKTLFHTFVNFNYSFTANFAGAVSLPVWGKPILYSLFIFPAIAINGIFSGKSTGRIAPGLLFAFSSLVPVVAVYAFSVYYRPVFLFRYLFVFSAGYLFLVAAGLYTIRNAYLKYVLLVYVLAVSFTLDTFVLSSHEYQDKWRDMIQIVKKEFKEGDIIVIFPDGTSDPVNYYLAQEGGADRYPVKALPFVPRDMVMELRDRFLIENRVNEAMEPILKDRKRAWLVLNRTSDPREIILEYFKKKGPGSISISNIAPSLYLFDVR